VEHSVSANLKPEYRQLSPIVRKSLKWTTPY